MFARILLTVTLIAGGAQIVHSDAERLTQSGNQKLERGDARGAASDYRKALVADGNAFEARVNLGAALLRLGDVDAAIDTLEAASRVRPDSAPLMRNLGRAYLRAERWPDAVKVLQRAAKREAHPDNDRLLGIALHRSGHSQEALGHLESAVARNGKDLELLVELATVQVTLGHSDALANIHKASRLSRKQTAGGGDRGAQARIRNQLGVLMRRQKDVGGAVGEFQAATQLDPSYTPAWANLGTVLVEADKPKLAVSALQQAIRNDPDPQLRYLLGRALLDSDKPNDAIKALEEARSYGYDPIAVATVLAEAYEKTGAGKRAAAERKKAGPGNALTVASSSAKKGTALLNERKYAEAEPLLAEAAEKIHDDGGLYYNLGLARLHLRDPQSAEPMLEKAAKLMPAKAVIWYHLGAARESLGDTDGAIAAWEELLKHDGSRSDVRARLGHLYLERDRNQAALPQLQKAAKALPASLDIQYDLAVAYTRLGKTRAALKPLAVVVEKRPSEPQLREAYADALYKAGEPGKAAVQYAELVRQEPNVAGHRVNLAVSYRAAGNRTREKDALQAAAQIAPDDATIWADLGRLQFQDREWKLAAASFTRAAALDPTDSTSRKNAQTAQKNVNVTHKKSSWDEIKRTHLHLGVIIVRERGEAEAARKKVGGGADFKTVAKATSVHDTAVKGGDLGWQQPDQLPPWAKEPAVGLKKGELSPVVEITGGFAVFYRFED